MSLDNLDDLDIDWCIPVVVESANLFLLLILNLDIMVSKLLAMFANSWAFAVSSCIVAACSSVAALASSAPDAVSSATEAIWFIER